MPDLVPKLRRAVPWNRGNPTNPVQLEAAEGAARTLGMQVESVPILGPSDFDAAFKAVRGGGVAWLEP